MEEIRKIEENGCQHIFINGCRKGKRCGKINCIEHTKENRDRVNLAHRENDAKNAFRDIDSIEMKSPCQAIFKCGVNKGKVCGKLFCRLHNRNKK